MIRPAEPGDLAAVEALLREAGLPVDGVAEQFGTFVVVHEGGRVLGAAGLEPYGRDALLRSVVVAEEARGRGYGELLARRVVGDARSRGVKDVYLLTTTAETFFARLGFERVTRQQIPAGLESSRELRGACPASATVMRSPGGD